LVLTATIPNPFVSETNKKQKTNFFLCFFLLLMPRVFIPNSKSKPHIAKTQLNDFEFQPCDYCAACTKDQVWLWVVDRGMVTCCSACVSNWTKSYKEVSSSVHVGFYVHSTIVYDLNLVPDNKTVGIFLSQRKKQMVPNDKCVDWFESKQKLTKRLSDLYSKHSSPFLISKCKMWVDT
jgi:hypothetical protein